MMYDLCWDKRHNGPYDRGSADAYYGRRFHPRHWVYDEDTAKWSEVTEANMSPKEIAAYAAGYENEDGRKEYT